MKNIKRKSLILTLVSLIGTGSVLTYHSKLVLAQNESNSLMEHLNALTLNDLSYQDKIYVYSLKAQYNNLTEEAKKLINEESLNKLNNALKIVDDKTEAQEFIDEFSYLLNNPTFAYQEKLAYFQNKYETENIEVKSYISLFNEENKAKIIQDGQSLLPEVYYDFRHPSLNGKTILNQGSESNKDASLKGSADVDNGYLSFGNISNSSGSYLELPNDLFTNNNDFTITIEYERENTLNEIVSLFAFGNAAYTDSSINETKYGIRTLFTPEYDRGPHIKMATRNSQDDPGYTGIVYGNEDFKNHILRTTIRYISEINCLQTCTVDTNTSFYCYVNQGCSYPSYNEYTIVDEVTLDFTKATCNYLGAKNGFDNQGFYSFDGKIYSFAFYDELISEYQIYGTDISDRNVGHYEIIEYVNHFDKVGSKFVDYYEEYGKMLERLYKDIMSIPYDYRKFYNQEHLEYFLEAYRLYRTL